VTSQNKVRKFESKFYPVRCIFQTMKRLIKEQIGEKMEKIKRVLSIIMAGSILFLAACGTTSNDTNDGNNSGNTPVLTKITDAISFHSVSNAKNGLVADFFATHATTVF